MLGKMAAATLFVATVLGASAAPRAAGGGDQQGAVAAAGAAPALQMHWLGADTQARCMDGSRYGYYFHFLFYFLKKRRMVRTGMAQGV